MLGAAAVAAPDQADTGVWPLGLHPAVVGQVSAGAGWLSSLYGGRAVAGSAVLLVQSLAIALLVVNIRRRRRAERDVRLNERRLHAIVEGIDDAVFVHDLRGRILDCNQAASRELGYSRDELLAMQTTDIDAAEFAAGFGERLERQLAEGRHRCDGTQLSKDGRRIPVSVVTSLIDYHGHPAILAVMHDMTGRIEADEEVRASRERLELAVAGADLGLWDRDIRTEETVFNERWAQMLGYTLAEIEPRAAAWKGLIHPDDRPRVFAALECHMSGQTPSYEAEYRMQTKAGQWAWILSRGKVVERDKAGQPTRIVGTHLDTTARKVAEERYRLLFNQMLDGFALHEVICNADGTPCDYRFLEANPAFERLTGLRVADIINKTIREVTPDIEPYWIETFGRVALTGEPAHFENFSGTLGRHYVVTAFRPAEGQFACIFQDISERLRAEEERQKLERQVQHTQKLESLGVLAGGIAHDFNNLLTGVLGHTELVLGALPTAHPVLHSVQEIEVLAKRAAELCQQMLAYSGRGRCQVATLDLNTVAREMADLLQLSIAKGVVLELDLHEWLPGVEADATQIRQVLMNLIINASEAIAGGTGTVHVSTKAVHCDQTYLADAYLAGHIAEGLYVSVEIRDTGCGMAPETLDRMFDPFFTTKFTGRGLGLAAVLGIIRGHKGALRVDSTPGHGTTFCVLLPASTHTVELAPARTEETDAWCCCGRILLVDDEQTVRDVTKLMLEGAGFEVTTAEDGIAALEIFRECPEQFACVLLDLTMPRLDGEGALAAMRRMDGHTPVILSSGYSESEIMERFAGKGIAGFVHKPYRKVDLLTTVCDVIGPGARREPQAQS